MSEVLLHYISLHEVKGAPVARELWSTTFLAYAGPQLVHIGLWPPPAPIPQEWTDLWVPPEVMNLPVVLAHRTNR